MDKRFRCNSPSARANAIRLAGRRFYLEAGSLIIARAGNSPLCHACVLIASIVGPQLRYEKYVVET